MQVSAIPRVDAGAEGIHLVWSWPDVLPLSHDGFDIQRLETPDEHWEARCESIDSALIQLLRAEREYKAPLGPLRMRSGATFSPIFDETLLPSFEEAGAQPRGFGDPRRSEVNAQLSTLLASTRADARLLATDADVFIQELEQPVERASVEASGRVALVMAMRAGKVVTVSPASTLPATIQLRAPSIDTIVVYVVSPKSLTICVYERDAASWAQAPYVVRGLALPIHEADATLTTHATEYAAARARLLAGEALHEDDFERLAKTLRGPTAASALGRSGERILLVRSDASQSYEEIPFATQLAALAVSPKARRVLGLGFRDTHGLVPGHAYTYRVTGRYRAEDLTDAIYDIHRVPASTTLPAAFFMRDVGFRFQTPVKVVLDPPPSSAALHAVSRRGIRIDTTGYDASWLLPSFGEWSAIVSFPRPVSKIVLEVAPGHSFSYAAGLPWLFGSPALTPVPAGPRVELSFAAPVLELRLAGTGTLYAVRLPSGSTGIVELHAYTDAIVYAAAPLPAPPLVFTAYNLQTPATPLVGPIDESTVVPTRPPVGFKLNWLPATTAGLATWPDDLDAGPPLEAIAYQIEHRRVTPPATYDAWEPIAGDDNLTLGSRDATTPAVRLEYGCDLDALFPAIRPRSPGAGFALHLSDVFGEKDPTGYVRPMPPLGSYHQYQIRAVDAVGRISAIATTSNIARLEKHVPPPMPVGPQPAPSLDARGHVTKAPGPRARAILRGAPGLTAADVALLGAHDNAIVLEWGWRSNEREVDPTTTEFRVYVAAARDVVDGRIVAVSSAPPYWKLALTTSLPLVADELIGQRLTSNGYAFRIAQNDAGTTPTILVDKPKPNPAKAPVTGAVTLARRLRPEHQRPRGWDDRIAIHPLTKAASYQHVFYDLLTLSPSHPRDAIWVGVSAADAQPYVADERTKGANANRAGNESAIATSAIVARYRGQPTFSVPPPIGDVPERVTDEPTGRQVLVTLDVAALLGKALPPGAHVALHRCSSDDVISRVSVSGGAVVLTHPNGKKDAIAFANPNDQAAVLATLGSNHPHRIANKYLLYILAHSSDAPSFFARVSDDLALDPHDVVDRLPPRPGRFFYLVRLADAAGHLSTGGALLPVVVRVSSTAPAPPPRRRAVATDATTVKMKVGVPVDLDTTHALLFAAFASPGTSPLPQGDAELLRVPNRRDLYPNNGLRLRLSDGTLLAPAVVKSLDDGDVVVENDGTRVAELTAAATTGAWATLWCFALTRDGVPSRGCGPFGIGVRA